MWVYFNNKGQLIKTFTHVGDTIPNAGTTNFKIFAFFKDVDLDTFSDGYIKLYRPDGTGGPINFSLPMTRITHEFVTTPEEQDTNPFIPGHNYNGFEFDFSNFTIGEVVTPLLDTSGIWKAVITLKNGAGTRFVQGLMTFVVGSGNEDEDAVQISIEEAFEHLTDLISGKLNKNSTRYIRLVSNIATTELTQQEFPEGSLVFDMQTGNFYKIRIEIEDDVETVVADIYYLDKYVNVDQAQTITGQKTFTAPIIPNGGLAENASDENPISVHDIKEKQEKLVSGQNIKTINGQDILGGGNLNIPAAEHIPWGNLIGDIKNQEDLQEEFEKVSQPERISFAYNLVTNANGYTMPNGQKFGPEVVTETGTYRVYQDRYGTPITSEISIKSYLRVMTGNETIDYYKQNDGKDCYLFLASNNTVWKLQRNAANHPTNPNELWAWKVNNFPLATKADLLLKENIANKIDNVDDATSNAQYIGALALKQVVQELREQIAGRTVNYVLRKDDHVPGTDIEAQTFHKADGTPFTSVADFNAYVDGRECINDEFASDEEDIDRSGEPVYIIVRKKNYGDKMVLRHISETNSIEALTLGCTIYVEHGTDRWYAGSVVFYRLEVGNYVDLESDQDIDGFKTFNDGIGFVNDWTVDSPDDDANLYFERNGNINYFMSDSAFSPGSNDTRDLGSSSLKWKDLYLSTSVKFNNSSYVGVNLYGTLQLHSANGEIQVFTNLNPDTNNYEDLGNASRIWKTLYVKNISDGTNTATTTDVVTAANEWKEVETNTLSFELMDGTTKTLKLLSKNED